MNISDSQLKNIIRNVYREAHNSLPPLEELDRQYPMTRKFKRWMKSALKGINQTRITTKSVRTTKKIAIMFIAAILAAAITISAVGAVREWFFKIVSEIFPTHTELYYEPAESAQENQVFVVYAPNIIPDGYDMYDEPYINEHTRNVRIQYRNSDGDRIIFKQMFHGTMNIDTEDATVENIQVKGHEALYVQKGEMQIIQGRLDNSLFSLYIRDEEITKEEAISIAESIGPIQQY